VLPREQICAGEDLNLHAPRGTRPSTLRVYQFRHQRVDGRQSSARLADRRELAFERLALGLEPRRQREARAERRSRLVDEEAGAVRGDLEQDPVGQPEVDRAEVLAVMDAGRAQAELEQAVEPDGL